jgi:predicted transcriptional regulator
MPARRFKIEFFDGNGIKHTISLEGEVPKEKIVQVLDYVELMGGVHSSNVLNLQDSDKKFHRIRNLVISNFSGKVFKSKDVQASYSEVYGEKIPLSTVSTYLSRLVDRGILSRGGSSGEWHYAVSSSINGSLG